MPPHDPHDPPPQRLAPVEVIERSRRGDPVDPASVEEFARLWLDGAADDALMSAWCMVACLRGLESGHVEALTRALIASGDRLELGVLGPTGDTHSTGGVGDTTTLVAAPLAAALGVRVAKMSGRGLAHTGGTIDKLEAIPGFTADLPLARFVRQVRDTGVAVVAQTERLTPGDRRLYALRDRTGTVPSAGLVAASIMSKKLAGGAGAIHLDVKCGDGGFFASLDEARSAARLMAGLAAPWGRSVRWAVTDMEQPLGRAVGNALEVREAAEVLRGEGPGDLRALAVHVAGDLAEAAGVAAAGQGRTLAAAALDDGAALAAAERWIEAQDGDPAVWTDPAALPAAPLRVEVQAPEGGWVAAVRARGIGEAARWLGAGRLHSAQSIDPVAGLEVLARVGDRVDEGQPLAVVHARDDGAAAHAREMALAAVEISGDEVAPRALVLDEGGDA